MTYQCRKCGSALSVSEAKAPVALSQNAPPKTQTVTVTCSDCKTVNSFEVPVK
jgi:RNase P subunit RPR2